MGSRKHVTITNESVVAGPTVIIHAGRATKTYFVLRTFKEHYVLCKVRFVFNEVRFKERSARVKVRNVLNETRYEYKTFLNKKGELE